MVRNIPLSTIGVKVSYCIEAAAGTRPKQGYTVLDGVYSTPSFNISPSTADATSFANKEYTTKIQLLKEMPDNIEFGIRFGQKIATQWETLVSAYEDGIASGKETWFCIDIPGYSKSIFFTGRPSKLGMPEMTANSGIDTSVFVTPTGEPEYAEDPTGYIET